MKKFNLDVIGPKGNVVGTVKAYRVDNTFCVHRSLSNQHWVLTHVDSTIIFTYGNTRKECIFKSVELYALLSKHGIKIGSDVHKLGSQMAAAGIFKKLSAIRFRK